MSRAFPMLAAALTLVTMAYFGWGRLGEISLMGWIASSIAIAGAVLGAIVPARCVRAHVAVTAVLMLAVASFATMRVIGRWPFAWDAFGDPRYAGFLAIMGIVVAVGLLRGALWARWAAISFASGSLLGSTLNSIGMRGSRDEMAWLAGLGVVGGLTIISQLVRPAVRDHFAKAAQHAVWASRDRLVRSARWAAIANFAAGPMLILYAFGQPVAPATTMSALIIAPVIGLGSALVVMRRAVGVLVLAVGGIALAAHTLATLEYVRLDDIRIVFYYACFWMPAAVLGVFAGALALWRARSI